MYFPALRLPAELIQVFDETIKDVDLTSVECASLLGIAQQLIVIFNRQDNISSAVQSV